MSIFLIVLFFLFMMIGLPVAVSLGVSSIVTIFAFSDIPLNIVAQSMFSSMNSFIMVAVPLFILTGIIMDEGNVAKEIFNFSKSVVGWLSGGLGHVNIFASLIFAGMAGSSVADVASTGRISINAMHQNGYSKQYATAVTLVSSMLATVIPPSILMVIAASTAGVSIGQALFAGLIPGLIIALIMMVINYIYCKKKNIGDKTTFSPKYIVKSFLHAFPALLAPVILLGGILSGYFTATEAAAIAALYTLIIAVVVYRGVTIRELPGIFFRTAKLTGTILFIAVTAQVASWVFEFDGLPGQIAAYVSSVSDNPTIILFLLFIFLLIVGMFMDATAAIFVLTPILLPTINAVGIDPLFFVVFMVMVLSFGLITPPVGVCLYAASHITGLSIEEISKSTVPWMLIAILMLMIFIIFPDLITEPTSWLNL
ncbi:TRAP transporter large permease [Salibacterium halotolerans]|uniref:TRAP transporter, DctM subunit n=1 Tax=Salibacterium halotolerans TaxID=1884432 RepID=A0A1I5LBZ2_9BACI|nr:TRAP transporter large permease [Salibacterium halotolerans]SFO94231.1 TRAP transporter, DctM subunit [Salibacterium halotolerans]